MQCLPLPSKGPEQVVVLHLPAPAAVVTRTARIDGGINHSFVPDDMFDKQARTPMPMYLKECLNDVCIFSDFRTSFLPLYSSKSAQPPSLCKFFGGPQCGRHSLMPHDNTRRAMRATGFASFTADGCSGWDQFFLPNQVSLATHWLRRFLCANDIDCSFQQI